MTAMNRIFQWWVRDYPLLDGRVRGIVYLLLPAVGYHG
jgi:hypothetical protein